jgi:hypothetical protein
MQHPHDQAMIQQGAYVILKRTPGANAAHARNFTGTGHAIAGRANFASGFYALTRFFSDFPHRKLHVCLLMGILNGSLSLPENKYSSRINII